MLTSLRRVPFLRNSFGSVVFLVFWLLLTALPTQAEMNLFDPYRADGIVVAQEADMPPMSFTGPAGTPKGYIIDLWRKWSDETGIPVTFHLVDWADTLTAVKDGTAHVHGGLFYTEERDAYLDYSQSFFPSMGGFFVHKNRGIENVSALHGREVGVIKGSFYDSFIRTKYPDMKPYQANTSTDLVNASVMGKVDAFLADYPTLMYQVGAMGKARNFEVLELISEQTFRAAVAEGNENLLYVVDQGLSRISQDERDAIMNRWIVNEKEEESQWLVSAVIMSAITFCIALFITFAAGRFRA